MTEAGVTALTATAVLFDMDGTIVDSTGVVEHMWGGVAERFGLDAAEVLEFAHGRQSRDTFARFLPDDADLDAELTAFDRQEIEIVEGIVEVPGAGALLEALADVPWAVVTSASRALALTRIAAAGLPAPAVLVSAEEVSVGKPDPEGYLLAAQRLGVAAEQCVIFEDAEAGVRSAVASGGTVVVVGQHRSPTTEALHAVADLTHVSVTNVDAVGLTLRLG